MIRNRSPPILLGDTPTSAMSARGPILCMRMGLVAYRDCLVPVRPLKYSTEAHSHRGINRAR